MKPLEEAQHQVLSAISPLPALSVPLLDALGLVLAEDVIATEDVPSFANSAVDGYAVRAIDTDRAPSTLLVLEDVPAGSMPVRAVTPGAAIKVMTGAPIPVGADAVVRVEDTKDHGERVEIAVTVSPGGAIRGAGGDVRAGQLVFGAGTRLGPRHLGVLASLGVAEPLVGGRPRVAVISTGDEVRPFFTASLAPGQIRDSNRPLLLGLLASLGAEVLDVGIVRDDADDLRETLLQASRTCDAVLTSGGVSMGDYDLVKQVLAELGGIELWQVAMQPAKPFAFGSIGGKPLFGLPGNPVSVLVAFEQFVRPALLRMMGSPFLFRPRIMGRMAEEVATDPAKTVFLRVVVDRSSGEWLAAPAGAQSSNVLSATANADCFAVVPRGIGTVESGGRVILEMFNWPEEVGVDGR